MSLKRSYTRDYRWLFAVYSMPEKKILKTPDHQSPCVEIITTDSGLAVKKSYAHWPLWKRWTVGYFLASREFAILSKLQPSSFFPEPLYQDRPYEIVTSYIEGWDLEQLPKDAIRPVHIQQLEEALTLLHQGQIIHFDLGHDHDHMSGRPSNIRLSSQGYIHIIDFAGSLSPLQTALLPNPFRRLFQKHDKLAIDKLNFRYLDISSQQKHFSHWELTMLKVLGKITPETYQRMR